MEGDCNTDLVAAKRRRKHGVAETALVFVGLEFNNVRQMRARDVTLQHRFSPVHDAVHSGGPPACFEQVADTPFVRCEV